MKDIRTLTIWVLVLGLMLCWSRLGRAEPMGAAFTYQGRLTDTDLEASGKYDFQFKLYDDPGPSVGNQIGSDVDKPDVDVIDGYFAVKLDFGIDVFDGNALWLQIGVRPGVFNDPCEYTVMPPRQQVTPAPYALYAKTSGSDGDWIIDRSNVYSAVSGNVGIGTTSPAYKLTVMDGDVYIDGSIRLSPPDGGSAAKIQAYVPQQLKPPFPNLAVRNPFSAGLSFFTMSFVATIEPGGGVITRPKPTLVERIRITPRGNVGINTTEPARDLHVNDVMRLQPRDKAPSSPREGDIYMDSTRHKLMVYDGTAWRACW